MQEVEVSDRMVHCRVLGKMLPGLPKPPYRNALGQKIFEEVSKEAWDTWLRESVRIINTYRVDLVSKEGQRFMLEQTAIYFGFEDGEAAETAWQPPTP